MLVYRFSFLCAATAIAYSEVFAASAEETAASMEALPKASKRYANHAELVKRCVDETGFDPSFADHKNSVPHVTRKGRATVDRMRKTGITERDLELEREEGYRDGRNEQFFCPPAARRLQFR